MVEARARSLGDGALLLDALRSPDELSGLSPAQWDLLVRLARRARLLGRLEDELSSSGTLGAVPERAANHLVAGTNLARHRQTLLTWELNRVLWALDDVEVPLVVLKGAAYVLAGLPPARGRLFADLDLLVPESRIEQVEKTLLARGWYRTQLDPYDERYYRIWMHEIPPLRHRERETEIDIHHTIVPRTSRLSPAASLLIEASRNLPGTRVRVLAPADMVLHALVHLFLEGDPHEGLRLRDLLDVHGLLEHFGREEPGFWKAIVPRARELGLLRPLYYGLRFSGRLLGTSIPEAVLRDVESAAPSPPIRALMDRLVPQALLPDHPDRPRWRAGVARWLIYVRAHALRMPPLLLVRHLGYKTWLRVRGMRKEAPPSQQDLKAP